jgi:LacI family transcriptional regulator
MRDVAVAAGVSTATVSRVLNSSAEVDLVLVERVMRAVEELNYRPNLVARSLRRRTTQVIALIISDVENPFFTSVCRGVEDVAQQSGYSVLLCNADEDLEKERQYVRVITDQNVAGLIISPASEEDTDISPLMNSGVPVITVDRRAGAATDTALIDNRHGAQVATEHLLASGARRVACITGTRGSTTARDRLQGYLDALTARCVDVDPSLQTYADFKEEGGYAAAAAFVDMAEPPDALFVANNRMTAGALNALHDRGVTVPTDVSVVGWDEFPWASSVRPSITTVRQPTYEIGKAAAQLLIERLADRFAAPREVVLHAELVVRESSVKPHVEGSV